MGATLLASVAQITPPRNALDMALGGTFPTKVVILAWRLFSLPEFGLQSSGSIGQFRALQGPG